MPLSNPTLIPNNPALTLQSPGTEAPLALDKAFTAADVTNGNAFLASGNDVLIIQNTDASAHDVVIYSAVDSFGRYADFTYSVGPGVFSFVNIIPTSLYTQAGTNQIQFLCTSALVEFLALTA